MTFSLNNTYYVLNEFIRLETTEIKNYPPVSPVDSFLLALNFSSKRALQMQGSLQSHLFQDCNN